MAGKSAIEWTEATWNPVTGCTKVSAGCKHCYAAVFAARLRAMGAPGYEHGFRLTLHPGRLDEPARRRVPTTYFVNSMSDLFHPDVPSAFVDRVMEVIECTPRHRYQILTKRPEVMAAYFTQRAVPRNAWLGVSVENRRYGLPRVGELRAVDAATRFLSVEPLLEDLGALDLAGVHWVIGGGESGSGARPMRPEWARAVRDRCRAAGVPFFFKQWGAWGGDGVRRSKKANGRLLDGRVWDETPA